MYYNCIMKWIPFILLTFGLNIAAAQIPVAPPTLEWAAFRQQVLDNHPLALQANLYRDQAKASLLRARGGFDPKSYAEFSNKNFTDKNYYRYTEAGIKYPTWLGLELKGAYNLTSGEFLNSESKLPKNGQAVFGFNWTLGQGLLLDERRAGLLQSKIGLETGDAERADALNDLLLDAAKAYWNWVLTDNQVRIFQDALQQAEIRNEAISESFRQGERSPIDTLETFIQVQNRRLDVNFAQTDLQNAALALQVFLWDVNQQIASISSIAPAPALLTEQYAALAPQNASALLEQARLRHPALRLYAAKLQALDVERRLKIEKRKPVLDLNYNLLGNGWSFFPTPSTDGPGVLLNDIKWGIQFSYPILNRKARGDLQITQIKTAQTDFALRQKRQEIEMKVQQYANELNNLSSQINLYQGIVSNRRILLAAENTRFSLGESSVFLINTREQAWLDAQVKYLKLLSEYQKAQAGLRWAAGTP